MPSESLATATQSYDIFVNGTIDVECGSPNGGEAMHSGTPAMFYCRHLTISGIILKTGWRLNGKVINTTGSQYNNSRIRTDVKFIISKFNTTENTILFSPVLLRDSGTLEYYIVTPEGTYSKSFSIYVWPPPSLTLSSLSASLPEESNFTIICTVVNFIDCCASTDTNNIKWFKDNKPFVGISDRRRPWYSTLKLTNIQLKDEGIYTCSFTSTLYSLNASLSLGVYPKDITPCPVEVDSRGYKWNITGPGQTSAQACSNGYTGKITRVCRKQTDGSGKWEKSNYSNCINSQISGIEDTINDLENGVGDSSVINSALDGLYNVTDDSTLTSGDIIKSNEILNKILDSDTSTSTLDRNAFFGILDNTLSDDHIETWREINENEGKSGSMVLELVSRSGAMFGKHVGVGDSFSVKMKNLVVSVSNTPSGVDIRFPQNTTGTEEDHGANINFPKENFGTQVTNVVSTSAVFKTASSILPMNANPNGSFVASVVLALSLDVSLGKRLKRNVQMEFKTSQENLTNPDISCVYWNFSLNGWSSEGCQLVYSTDSSAKCECNHLTNFAILMSPATTPIEHVRALEIISMVGCSISILGCLVTAIVHLVLWRHVKNGRNVLLVNLCFALAAANLVFLSAVDKVQIKELCVFITSMLHYLYLVVFFIMFAKGVLIYIAVKVVFKTQSKIRLLLLLVWGVPAVIVAITVGVSYSKEYYSQYYCWLTTTNGVLYAFVAPVLLIILVNCFIIVVVLYVIYNTRNVKSKSGHDKAKTGLRSMCTLLPILGVTWLFGILSINDELVVFQYLFAITNSLQGLFIFIFHCFLSPQVRNALRNRMRKYEVKTTFSGNTGHSGNLATSDHKLISSTTSSNV